MKFNVVIQNIHIFKLVYGDKWEEYIQTFTSEIPKQKICSAVLKNKNQKEALFYGFSIISNLKELNYACKDGSGTFKSSNYNPKT